MTPEENPFESGARKCVPAVLVYARSQNRVLMLHRSTEGTRGLRDIHSGKWNGLGGKLEADESAVEGARREFYEESGLDCPEDAFEPVGTLQFPNFKPHRQEDWLVFVFVLAIKDADLPKTPQRSPANEGSLEWVPEKDLLRLNLWEGDRHFMPLVLDRVPFLGTFHYNAEKRLTKYILRRLV